MAAIPAYYVLQNKAGNLVLSTSATTNTVVMENRKVLPKGGLQKWAIEVAKDAGSYILTDNSTGLILDSAIDKKVYLHDTNNAGAYQAWQLLDPVNGYYILKNKATGFVLTSTTTKTVSTSDLIPTGSNGADNQRWQLIAIFS